jgi:DNA-binding NtrC family response regulator
MGEYLESVGLEHDLAVSAEQARNRLKRSGYDVVVSDFNMPGESGLDLLSHVSFMYPKTRFILLTGYDDPRIKRESMKMGAHAYIQKPFYLNELLQTIINLMRRDDQKEVPAA